MKNQSEHPLKAIRRAGVPLVAYETSDPAQTILSCVKALNGKAETSPVVVWDIVNGQRGMNEAPERALSCGCRAKPRFGNTRVTYVVTGYGAEFICPLGHARGDVLDVDGQPLPVVHPDQTTLA